jgi:hypothetical protein
LPLKFLFGHRGPPLQVMGKWLGLEDLRCQASLSVSDDPRL